MSILKDYRKSIGSSGVIPWIINNIPYHEVYYELFAGSATLYHAKKPALCSFLNDINPGVVQALKIDTVLISNTVVYNLPVLEFISRNSLCPSSTADFVYLDPPYHKDDRRSGAEIYDYEMMTDDDHMQLLTAILASTANIMISCGENELYQLYLKEWRRKSFNTYGHRGPRTEVIYMNYDEPALLHQYDYLGNDYKQRQALSRKRERWQQLAQCLPPYQRHVLIQELIKNNPAEVQHFMAVAAGKNSQ